MKKKQLIISILLGLLIFGCSVSNKTETIRKNNFFVLAGVNKGGITENTDMKVVSNADPDAYTGATRIRGNFGGHYERVIKRNSVETGIDVIFNQQQFKYNDVANSYFGDRDIFTTQIRIPVTYNINLFRNKQSESLVQFKLGLSPGWNLHDVTDKGSNLPEYSFTHFTNSYIVGLKTMPVRFQNQSRLGFEINFLMGSKVYDDFYQKGDMPGISYINFSVVYQFK